MLCVTSPLAAPDARRSLGRGAGVGLASAACSTTLKIMDAVRPLPGNVAHVSAGAVSACAVTLLGEVYCWGSDRGGVLGSPQPGCEPGRCDADEPRGVVLPEPAEEISVGREHACAVTRTGRAFCWGAKAFGQLGSAEAPETCMDLQGGDTPCSPAPVEVAGSGDWVAVAAGDAHTCGIIRTGRVRCWGWARGGRLGDIGSESGPWPQPIGVGGEFRSVTADSAYACALGRDGRAWCWGDVPFPAAPNRPSTMATPWQAFPEERFVAFDAGSTQVCGVTVSGTVRCRGAGEGPGVSFKENAAVGFGVCYLPLEAGWTP